MRQPVFMTPTRWPHHQAPTLSWSFDRDADLLLVMSPPWFTKMPPLGVAYLLTSLKTRGHKVEVADLNVELFNSAGEAAKQYWAIEFLNKRTPEEAANQILTEFDAQIERFVDAYLQTNIPAIGFSITLVNEFTASDIAKRIKQRDPSRIVIFGGPGCHWEFQRNLITPGFVDYFIVGEGEESLDTLLRHLKRGDPTEEEIAGLIVWRGGAFYPMKPPQEIRDLDAIPFPTFEEFTLDKYHRGESYRPLPLILSRGCVRRCTFCLDWRLTPQFRYRNPDRVFENFAYYVSHYGTKTFEFNDLLCNGIPAQLERLCDLLIEARFGISWVSYAIIRKDTTPALLKKMKESGCHTLIYGMESASNNVLKRMRKNYTAETAERVIQDTHHAGICTNANLIVGYPGETEEDFQETVAFLQRNKDYIDEVTNISGLVLMEGAELAQNREQHGVQWQPGTDPILFHDENGLDHRGRIERVERLIKIVEDLGLRSSIINKPKVGANALKQYETYRAGTKPGYC